MEKEVWKDIMDCPGYQVSDMGNVRSFWKPKHGPIPNGVLLDTPRIVKQTPAGRNGYRIYLAVKIIKRDTYGVMIWRKSIKVHRLVLATFVGACPAGMEARHINGNGFDNRLSNLCYGTHTENMFDKKTHGTERIGSTNPFAKLTEAQVIEIRNIYAGGGITQSELASKFGVGHTIIGSIINRRKWKHI